LGLMFCLWRLCGKRISVSDEEKVHAQGGSQAQPLSSPVMKGKSRQSNPRSFATAGQVEEVMTMRASPVVQILKAPPSLKGISEKGQARLSSGKSPSTVIAATAFSIADLQVATNSFAQENLIGEGSLGRVYRGDFPDGQVVAVKKLDTSAAQVQDNEEFLAAVCTMAHLHHANIMELIGYCAEHGQHLLVYQYMNGGTLDDTLHTSDKTALHISWNMRVKIALGAARALEYLHEVCLPAMVHRNFKSANILLDDETIPHLSDCGIAALIPIDGEQQRQMSAQMLGSLGYCAPEYTMSGLYTMQSDVYSFGVVLLELLTGRKPFDSTRTRSEQSLVRWATPQLHDIDALVKMVDPALKGMYPAKSLSRFADIIALCVQVSFQDLSSLHNWKKISNFSVIHSK
jgi:serine/threonine protein kinase